MDVFVQFFDQGRCAVFAEVSSSGFFCKQVDGVDHAAVGACGGFPCVHLGRFHSERVYGVAGGGDEKHRRRVVVVAGGHLPDDVGDVHDCPRIFELGKVPFLGFCPAYLLPGLHPCWQAVIFGRLLVCIVRPVLAGSPEVGFVLAYSREGVLEVAPLVADGACYGDDRVDSRLGELHMVTSACFHVPSALQHVFF